MKLNETINKLISEDFSKKAYSDFVRKHVTYRGMTGDPYADHENGQGAMLGRGLYTTKDKSMARKYGTLWYVVNAIPSNPKIFQDLNQWETWFYNHLVFPYSKAKGLDYPDKRDFIANTTIEAELQKLGYDGIVIKGREMVHFNPKDVLYFPNERQLAQYVESLM